MEETHLPDTATYPCLTTPLTIHVDLEEGTKGGGGGEGRGGEGREGGRGGYFLLSNMNCVAAFRSQGGGGGGWGGGGGTERELAE